MEFRPVFKSFFLFLILGVKESWGLMFYPYKIVRRLVLSGDAHLFFIYSVILFVFFVFQSRIKPLALNAYESFLLFWFNLFLSCLFFYIFLRIHNQGLNFATVVSVYSSSLLPTILFFYSNLFFYYLLPPPRTLSLTGLGFSYVYLTWVSALVFWKLSLVYLCLRFLGRLSFFNVIYLIVLYISVFSVYYLYLYQIGFIRLPVI